MPRLGKRRPALRVWPEQRRAGWLLGKCRSGILRRAGDRRLERQGRRRQALVPDTRLDRRLCGRCGAQPCLLLQWKHRECVWSVGVRPGRRDHGLCPRMARRGAQQSVFRRDDCGESVHGGMDVWTRQRLPLRRHERRDARRLHRFKRRGRLKYHRAGPCPARGRVPGGRYDRGHHQACRILELQRRDESGEPVVGFLELRDPPQRGVAVRLHRRRAWGRARGAVVHTGRERASAVRPHRAADLRLHDYPLPRVPECACGSADVAQQPEDVSFGDGGRTPQNRIGGRVRDGYVLACGRSVAPRGRRPPQQQARSLGGRREGRRKRRNDGDGL